MGFTLTIKKRHLTFLLVFIVVLGAGVVLAQAPNPPNPGHLLRELQPCADGQIIKFVSGTGWICDSIAAGWCPGGSCQGTLALNDFDIRLRALTDPNHYLKYKYVNGVIDGVELGGYDGGRLVSTFGGENVALRWRLGNVGIGTNNPNTALDIKGSDTSVQLTGSKGIIVDGWNGGGAVFFGGGIEQGIGVPTAAIETSWGGEGQTNPQIAIGVIRDSAKANILMDYRGNTAIRNNRAHILFARSDGNVGIGTSSPTQKLDVEGDIKANRLDISDIDCRGGNCVRSDDIADRAINWWDIALGGVGPGELQDNAVTSSKIANFAVTVNKIAAGVVGTAEILDGGVTSADILDATIRIGDISLETLPATTAWNTLERSCTNGFVISCHCNCVGGGNLLECGASTANTCRGRCNTGNVQVQGFCINN